jgi:hypothetical protein
LDAELTTLRVGLGSIKQLARFALGCLHFQLEVLEVSEVLLVVSWFVII